MLEGGGDRGGQTTSVVITLVQHQVVSDAVTSTTGGHEIPLQCVGVTIFIACDNKYTTTQTISATSVMYLCMD